MKEHRERHLKPPLSDWNEVRALILPFVLQLGFALSLICVLALTGRAAQAGDISRPDAARQGNLLFADGYGGDRPVLTEDAQAKIEYQKTGTDVILRRKVQK